MTRIIMIRHGQSLANAEHRFAGHSDFDLSELGRAQAAAAAEHLYGVEKEKVDVIYSSDLLRAHNTALPFAKKYGLAINDTEELREIYAGAWEGLAVSEIEERFGRDFDVWKNDFSNSRCTDGEAVSELYERIVASVCRIARDNGGKTVLLATHATPVRAIECYSQGKSGNEIHTVTFLRNAAMSIFEYDPADNSIRPIRTNIEDHLSLALQTTATPIEKNSRQ